MFESIFKLIDDFISGISLALNAGAKLAIIGFILYLLYLYIKALLKYPFNTIKYTLAFLAFPAVMVLSVVLISKYVAIIPLPIDFLIGLSVAFYISTLIAGISKKSMQVEPKEKNT